MNGYLNIIPHRPSARSYWIPITGSPIPIAAITDGSLRNKYRSTRSAAVLFLINLHIDPHIFLHLLTGVGMRIFHDRVSQSFIGQFLGIETFADKILIDDPGPVHGKNEQGVIALQD